jgi:fructose-bisphosphate aldolase class I
MFNTISALLAEGKGLLAADESFPTLEKRFADVGVANTEDNRRAYRELLFTTPRLGEFISGVILFDETIHQRIQSDVPMPEILTRQGIVPGIKVDQGTSPLANFEREKITRGLDHLRERLTEYHRLGARFTKWRAVFKIGPSLPTRAAMKANASALAQFAALSQEAGLVPIVEPEVLMTGKHSISRCEEVTRVVLQSVFDAMAEQRVVLEEMILKTGMVLSGEDCPDQADDNTVAEYTRRCLLRVVPAAVPGIVFLSGGQSPAAATHRLNAICIADHFPWKLTFSFGRALQSPALESWKGFSENVASAQEALHHRARCNSAALSGSYTVEMGKGSSKRLSQ